MGKTGLAMILLMLSSTSTAEGWEIITTVGGGLKFNNYSSALFDPECNQAFMFERGERGLSSCGGDNPIFHAWVLAAKKCTRLWCHRLGLYHQSHAFDGGEFTWFGGDKHELNYNCFCYEGEFNWTKWKRKSR